MAAAEARAAWQRAANRCIVQEDAKRAPKIPPCCNSSSSSSDSGNYQNAPGQIENPQICTFAGPLSWNHVGPASQLPSDAKWWLQFQPNFAYQKEFLYYDQLNLDEKKTVGFESGSEFESEPSSFGESGFELEQMWNVSMNCAKNGSFERERKIKCEVNKSCEDSLIKKRNEPWWKVADEKELASIVAQKGRGNLENCDLPKPSVKTACYDFVERNFCEDEGASLVLPPLSEVICTEFSDRSESDGYFRRTESESENSSKTSTGERNRADLLEALCHSQTRAREAELAAKKSDKEKDDIIKLLFRQASHLFACKQWLKLLQLENMCLQLRLSDQIIIPPFKSKREKERKNFGRREKDGRNFGRYFVMFAVGLGLAGAGLLFGWTLGWLLPKL